MCALNSYFATHHERQQQALDHFQLTTLGIQLQLPAVQRIRH
jgi:hypothetical protein